MLKNALFSIVLILSAISISAQPAAMTPIAFNDPRGFQKLDAGSCNIKDSALFTAGAYAAFGEDGWKDYCFEFDAKAMPGPEKALIWAGFRAADRDDRYVLALKGGVQNDLYLARLGYMGNDAFLALKHLDFQVEQNRVYHFRIELLGSRIRIFLNHEKMPRIDIMDQERLRPAAGKITLGGGWLPACYTHLKVRRMRAGELDGVPATEYKKTPIDKEKERVINRQAYNGLDISRLMAGQATGQNGGVKAAVRNEVSLNGTWLFAPGYMIDKRSDGYDPAVSDKNWHTMRVPDFWNPSRIWLFGEKYGPASKGVSDSYFQKETDRCEAYTFDYKRTKVGWYRQWVTVPKGILQKHVSLNFDAVSKSCEVWINGRKAGSHIGMFGAFSIDISKFLKPGKNLIAIKVEKEFVRNIADENKVIGIAASVVVTPRMLNDLPHGFFDDSPAGIWQPVSMVITSPVHIQDVYIRSDSTRANVEVTVENGSDKPCTFSLGATIRTDKSGKRLYQGVMPAQLSIAPHSVKKIDYPINGVHPALWSPEHPNLYDFSFDIKDGKNSQLLDRKTVRSGFKSFVIKDGLFYLNGHPYWLRGGNQTAMPLAFNDTLLALKFTKMIHDGNMMVTRTHTTPYTETWMNAADKEGVGVSFEGTWPWLMLGDTPIPDKQLLVIWEREMLDLVKKYRNHPSLLLWTINNEMKFYQLDPDLNRAKEKMEVVSELVRKIRKADPDHPVVFDSNYFRKQAEERFGKAFMDSIDDGDVDDIHQYTNWYDESIFDEFDGRFEKRYKLPGRPLISQEMSTGYPDETGHATRFYTFVHQNPSSLVGKFAYAYQDPKWFMQAQSFITKELGEALRRTNPQASGVLQFSQATWFSEVYDAAKIKPNRTFFAMKKVLQPVLVSAELWGRHFYAGKALPTRICIVNDQTSGKDLQNIILKWELQDANGHAFGEGRENIEKVPYYGRVWVAPKIMIPARLQAPKVNGRLVLSLYKNGHLISANDYDLVFGTNQWAVGQLKGIQVPVCLFDPGSLLRKTFDQLQLPYREAASIANLVQSAGTVAVIAAGDDQKFNDEDILQLKKYIDKGGKLLIVHGAGLAKRLFPGSIRGLVTSNREIANIEIPESGIFKDIAALDIRYFNDNKRSLPTVLNNAYQINRSSALKMLASSVKIHGYLSGNTAERMATLDKLKGFPIVTIRDQVILTTLNLEKAVTDPVAGRLLANMIHQLQGSIQQ